MRDWTRTEIRIGDPRHAHFRDRWMPQQYGLHFSGINIFAPGDDQVISAIQDTQIPLLIQTTHIPGSKPGFEPGGTRASS